MTPRPCALLVMAKSPVPGQAKTRLAPAFGPEGAAQLAAAALLDTMEAVRSSDVVTRIVALSGDLSLACDGDEIARALDGMLVVPQDGATFADRLVQAHRDAARSGLPVLQIGMDTPQVTGPALTMAADTLLAEGTDAVLGMATDGGWWALGVTEAATASVLGSVPMSRDDTGALTRAAIARLGCAIAELPVFTDVDTPEDARLVAGGMDPGARFPRALARLDHRPPGPG
jgi:glycosyltransferase A (GT-A) superfamily protein (DUF2064 family)